MWRGESRIYFVFKTCRLSADGRIVGAISNPVTRFGQLFQDRPTFFKKMPEISSEQDPFGYPSERSKWASEAEEVYHVRGAVRLDFKDVVVLKLGKRPPDHPVLE